MSPLSLLIDHSRLLGRVSTLYSFAPDVEAKAAYEHAVTDKAVEQHDERAVQLKGLVTGTLLFLPFLIGYFVACGSR
ncbi:hypothetical protein WJ542_12145 [Paraburkholderia sp. B3]|uniref:hypothetical protein n=1 Tax=Paraburkholderia sp. B3 TaxID=3134791 RepID=UPI003981CC94